MLGGPRPRRGWLARRKTLLGSVGSDRSASLQVCQYLSRAVPYVSPPSTWRLGGQTGPAWGSHRTPPPPTRQWEGCVAPFKRPTPPHPVPRRAPPRGGTLSQQQAALLPQAPKFFHLPRGMQFMTDVAGDIIPPLPTGYEGRGGVVRPHLGRRGERIASRLALHFPPRSPYRADGATRRQQSAGAGRRRACNGWGRG